jgi:Tfp pilus assembly protein PilF
MALALGVTKRWWWPTAPAVPVPTLGYQALQQGDWPQAETLFQQLSEQPLERAQSQGLAGLAALALARGDYPQALDHAAQAERLDPDIAYSHVIRGNVLWNQGQLAEAAAEYRLATEKPHALPWQQAMAYDRLGRLYAEQGEPAKALAHYDKAITQTQDMAAVYANKGHVLETLGKTQQALELYRKALDINPGDPLTTMLLRDAERRQQLARDQDQQAQLDRLVDELVQMYKEEGKPPEPGDGWTSRPLTLAFLDFQRQGSVAARAGEAEFVMLSVTHAMRTHGRVAIVERDVLHKVLAELKLSASDVVDAQAGLGQGKILAARLLATGTFTHFGQAGLVSLRLIDTETTLINATALHQVELSADLRPVLDQLARDLLQGIRQAYPLRGYIQRLTAEGNVVLNLGAWHGLTPGLVMQVLDDDTADRRIGRIEVTQVNPRSAQGRVLEQTAALAPGSKVQEEMTP